MTQTWMEKFNEEAQDFIAALKNALMWAIKMKKHIICIDWWERVNWSLNVRNNIDMDNIVN